MYKTYTGSGSQILICDGLLNGAAVPEGKYNLVLKNAKQPGKGRERDVAQVGVDMTPPEISYEIVKTATGRDTGELKIIVTDNQSGVDPTATVATNASSTIEPGVPVIQQVLTDKEKVEPKRQVRFYQLLFPDFVPTETQANSGGDFRVAAEGEAPAEASVVNFGSGQFRDNVGLPFQIAFYKPTDVADIEIEGSCNSSSGQFSVHRVFNFHRGLGRPDIYFMIIETDPDKSIDVTSAAKECLLCNARILSNQFTNSQANTPSSSTINGVKYTVLNRVNTFDLLLGDFCNGSGCTDMINKDAMSFYTDSPDGSFPFLKQTSNGKKILKALPTGYSGAIFMLAADLDRFPKNLASSSLSVNIDKTNSSSNIGLTISRDPKNFWKVSCGG